MLCITKQLSIIRSCLILHKTTVYNRTIKLLKEYLFIMSIMQLKEQLFIVLPYNGCCNWHTAYIIEILKPWILLQKHFSTEDALKSNTKLVKMRRYTPYTFQNVSKFATLWLAVSITIGQIKIRKILWLQINNML